MDTLEYLLLSYTYSFVQETRVKQLTDCGDWPLMVATKHVWPTHIPIVNSNNIMLYQ